jgi:tryptophan-rich sensory protein
MARDKSLVAALGFGAVCAGVAALGTLTMRGKGRPGGRWFRKLDKPAFQPPSWVFGPVWTLLYGAIAYSGFRVWRTADSADRTRALGLWAAQLALNGGWTPLFFGARKPAIALADLAALDGAATAYLKSAAKVDRTAALAVAPYLGWIGFATAINAAIVAKNR